MWRSSRAREATPDESCRETGEGEENERGGVVVHRTSNFWVEYRKGKQFSEYNVKLLVQTHQMVPKLSLVFLWQQERSVYK